MKIILCVVLIVGIVLGASRLRWVTWWWMCQGVQQNLCTPLQAPVVLFVALLYRGLELHGIPFRMHRKFPYLCEFPLAIAARPRGA